MPRGLVNRLRCGNEPACICFLDLHAAGATCASSTPCGSCCCSSRPLCTCSELSAPQVPLTAVLLIILMTCKFMTTTHLFAAANRHFSLSHPFPSSLPVHPPSSLFYNRFSALNLL